MAELNFIEIDTYSKNSPKQLVIFLHGYGSNKYDLQSLTNEFKSILPDGFFIFPDAAFPCEIGYGYQWFSLNDRSEAAMFKNIQPASIILDKFIDKQLARFSLTEENLILVGFSQGTMIALHAALRREKPCTIIGFSFHSLSYTKLL